MTQDTTRNNSGGIGLNTDVGVAPAEYDILTSFIKTKIEDIALLQDYVGAYLQVAQALNLHPSEFVKLLEQQGSDLAQDIFITGYLNELRYKNSKLGINLNLLTPVQILREIRA